MGFFFFFLIHLVSLHAIDSPPTLRINTQTANFALLFPTQLVRPGSQIQGLIQFYIDPGWHLYWKNPGDTGVAPTFDWQLPPGIQIKEVQWPAPLRLERAGTFFYGYEKTPAWIVTLSFDENLPEGTYPLTLSAFWLACDGTCVPSSQQFECSFTVSPLAPPIPSLPALQDVEKKLPVALEGGEAVIDKDRLVIHVPFSDAKLQEVANIFIFPEKEGIIDAASMSIWKKEGYGLEISTTSLPTAKDTLIQAKSFTGLVQLLSSKNEVLATYEVNIPFMTSVQPSSVNSPSSPAEGSQWKQKDVSKELQTMHQGNALRAILLLAFLGGIILNVTPCVLPIVGLKVLNLISFRSLKRLRILAHGVLFTLGILIAFWVLAGGLYLFESLGTTLGWGFQLQEPYFVVALIIILFCFAMNLFGLFEMGTAISAWAAEVEQGVGTSSPSVGPSLFSSFASGILATLIATPCTGPLLGSVLGFASTFQPTDGLILFSVIGLGMAFPFLLITAFPTLIRLLPRPGMWMIGVKQFFGFCLLITIAWLLWVLHAEVPTLSIAFVSSGLILLAVGLWIFGRWASPIRSPFCRVMGRLFALLFLSLGIVVFLISIDKRIMPLIHTVLPQEKSIQWEPFSKEKLEDELSEGHTVFVEFTAKWCLTCQTNKLSFLSSRVVDAFQKGNIVALEADWTNGNPEITSMLRCLGRNGVPVYAIFKAGKEPIILPELITPETIVKAISEA